MIGLTELRGRNRAANPLLRDPSLDNRTEWLRGAGKTEWALVGRES